MPEQINAKAVMAILYGLYKAIHSIAGSSAPAIMRKAAPDILKEMERLGVAIPTSKDPAKLGEELTKLLVSTGLCDDFSLEEEEEDLLKAKIKNCSFFSLTKHLEEEDVPPFGCPFAALTVALSERNLGARARLQDLAPDPAGEEGDTALSVRLYR